jgi:hypothetical protein
LTRQDKPELIMWSLNERDLNPDKDWKDGEGLKVVKKVALNITILIQKNVNKNQNYKRCL